MQKRILSLMLALAMMITVFAGCGGNTGSSESTASQSAASGSSESSASSEASVLPDQPIQRRRDRGADEHWL